MYFSPRYLSPNYRPIFFRLVLISYFEILSAEVDVDNGGNPNPIFIDRDGHRNISKLYSRLKAIRESRLNLLDSSETSDNDPKKLIEELTLDFQERVKQIELEELHLETLEPQDLDAFLEQVRGEVGSTLEENLKISNEIDDLTRTISEDLNLLDGDIESLAFPLNRNSFQGLNVRLCSGDARESYLHVSEDNKFEILRLQQQIEDYNSNISTLQDLDFVFKRIEAIGQIEDKLSEVKVLGFEGNSIQLALRTLILSSDGVLLRHRLDCVVEPYVVEHELLIGLVDKTSELQKVEIFPNDVPLDDVIQTVKSSSKFVSASNGSKLECLVKQVQYRILSCTLKRLVLKDAKKSRHSFEYSERDETITAHMVGGIDVVIKISQSWPMSDSGLNLLSVKNSSIHSMSVPPYFLCKIKELANSLDVRTRRHLVRFMDSIEEILTQEMHSER